MHAKTLDEVVQPYLHLPKTVQTALLRVETHPTFRSLTKSTLKVLKALVTRASATNGATAIRARLDTVAMQADVSAKTAQRALRTFDTLGWVKAATEGRSEYGVFCSKRYVFSAKFCELVHLPTKDKPLREYARETEMSDGAVNVDLSFKKDQQEISLQKRLQNPHPTPIQLPEALRKMASETGMLDTGVAKLRGIAHAQGYRLEDVYTVARKRLTEIGANAGRCYRYLLAAILNPRQTDFAGKAAQVERLQAQTDAKANDDAGWLQYRFKTYQAGPGRTVTLLADHAVVHDNARPIKIIPLRDMGLVVNDIEDGVLTEIERAMPPMGSPSAGAAISNDQVARAARALRESALADQDAAIRAQLSTLPMGPADNLDMIRTMLRPSAQRRGARPDAAPAPAAAPRKMLTQAMASALAAIRSVLPGARS
ncbi:hypothetical protein AAKU55_005091 [Oxalobacteraceae bacterium GrIS 1.11]